LVDLWPREAGIQRRSVLPPANAIRSLARTRPGAVMISIFSEDAKADPAAVSVRFPCKSL